MVMKTSMQSGIAVIIRRSVSILMIFATFALTNVAKAADFKGEPSHTEQNIILTNSTTLVPASNGPQTDAAPTHPEANHLNLTERVALFCVTNYGTFFIEDWQPAGTVCSVGLAYYPFVAYGVAE
jgi:hypothetical protein